MFLLSDNSKYNIKQIANLATWKCPMKSYSQLRNIMQNDGYFGGI